MAAADTLSDAMSFGGFTQSSDGSAEETEKPEATDELSSAHGLEPGRPNVDRAYCRIAAVQAKRICEHAHETLRQQKPGLGKDKDRLEG